MGCAAGTGAGGDSTGAAWATGGAGTGAAEAGDFRGQASHAQILIGEGRIVEAAGWLRRAVLAGSPAFLAHVANDLAASAHAEIREIAQLARDRGAAVEARAGHEAA